MLKSSDLCYIDFTELSGVLSGKSCENLKKNWEMYGDLQ